MPALQDLQTVSKQQSTGRPVTASQELTSDVERLRTEEQAKIDRHKQEELARLRELARFD